MQLSSTMKWLRLLLAVQTWLLTCKLWQFLPITSHAQDRVLAHSSKMLTHLVLVIWAFCPIHYRVMQPTIEKGLAYNEMLSSPDIKALFVMGANPLRHVEQLPSNLEFLVVQDILLTETAEQADVVLPAVTFAEKDGSMTNIDHHVQAIRHALRPLPGAKADWEILTGDREIPWTEMDLQ